MNWPISARRLASASLFSALLFAATGCEDASDLGVELPGTGTTSTEYRDFPVTASTVLQDSVETLKTNSYLIGRVRDNALGTTTANGYFNLKVYAPAGDTLPSAVAGTAAMPQLDSVVLVMPFESVSGSASAPLQVNVYPLQARLDEQGIYNSNSSVAVDATNPLGTSIVARLNGTQKITKTDDPNSAPFEVTVPDKTVRLKLNSAGNPLVNTVFDRLADKTTPFSQARLDPVWKGLSIQPTTNFSSAVVGFSAVNSVSRAVFYYHYTNKKGTGTLKGTYSIPFGNLSTLGKLNAPRYFTEIKTDLLAPFNRLQGPSGASSVPSGESGDVVYTQLGSGVGTKLEIPGLNTLKEEAQAQGGNNPAIAINRAELLIPVQPYTSLLFASPNTTYLYEANRFNQPLKRILLNSRVERLVLRDAVNQLSPPVSSIENQFDSNGLPTSGYYQQAAQASLYSLSDVNRTYSMVMTGYVQSYLLDKLSGTAPEAFILSPQLRLSGALGLERAVLDGKNIKLRVYYSKLQ